MSDEIQKHNLTVLYTLKVGDMVRFERKGYYHYGVYDGDGNVYHLTGRVETILGFGKQEVRKEDVIKVAGHSKMYKDNTREEKYDPLDTEDIVALAELYLAKGTKSKYNLRSFNCETFASMLRYGSGLSMQVKKKLPSVMARKSHWPSQKPEVQTRRRDPVCHSIECDLESDVTSDEAHL